jgi:hypothetical protein
VNRRFVSAARAALATTAASNNAAAASRLARQTLIAPILVAATVPACGVSQASWDI